MADQPWAEAVRPEQTRVEMTQIVLPSYTNAHGTAFGGQIAAWCDIAAAVAAQRFCRSPVVTVSMDQLHFLTPIRRGEVVVLRAQVNESWHSSIEVGVLVEAEHPTTGERSRCCTAYLTFVALDDEGRPRSVPHLDPGDDPDNQRRAREARLKMREIRRSHPT